MYGIQICCCSSISLVTFTAFCLLYFWGYDYSTNYNDSLEVTTCIIVNNTVIEDCDIYSKHTGQCSLHIPIWVTTVIVKLKDGKVYSQTDRTRGWSSLDDVHRSFAQNHPVNTNSTCYFDHNSMRVEYVTLDTLGYLISAYVFLSCTISSVISILAIVIKMNWERINTWKVRSLKEGTPPNLDSCLKEKVDDYKRFEHICVTSA